MSGTPTPDIVISSSLVDRLAGFLVFVQTEDTPKLLYSLKKLRETAAGLQAEIQEIRGPWVVCHLCNPPKKLLLNETGDHDVEIHHKHPGNTYAGRKKNHG